MKNIAEYMNEALESTPATTIESTESTINEAEITSESDFREYARKKFEEAFGDDLDEAKMNETIDGLLEDNKELVENGEWGELVGMLNQSFASKE